mmetsp:Transcript_14519/g.31934  ORF Transcript_14519/g.31934 Transcript_14519/m.31934 type:complete len:290 (+) Transcript_14519:766-1635(+)
MQKTMLNQSRCFIMLPRVMQRRTSQRSVPLTSLVEPNPRIRSIVCPPAARSARHATTSPGASTPLASLRQLQHQLLQLLPLLHVLLHGPFQHFLLRLQVGQLPHVRPRLEHGRVHFPDLLLRLADELLQFGDTLGGVVQAAAELLLGLLLLRGEGGLGGGGGRRGGGAEGVHAVTGPVGRAQVPLLQDDPPVRNRADVGESHPFAEGAVMGDYDHRGVVAAPSAEGLGEGVDAAHVEVIRGFVQQQHVAGPQGEHGEGHPGLLPPAEVLDQPEGFVSGQPESSHGVPCL